MMNKIAIIALTTLLGACSSFTSQPISGTYKGTLPCADCEKIEAVLTLNEDNTYEYNTVYFKRGKQLPFIEKGRYSRQANLIRLEESGHINLKVTEQYAELCDDKGNTVQSNHNYRLMKQ